LFGLLLLAAERGRAVDGIPWWRFGLWGAAATGATGWMAVRVPVHFADSFLNSTFTVPSTSTTKCHDLVFHLSQIAGTSLHTR